MESLEKSVFVSLNFFFEKYFWFYDFFSFPLFFSKFNLPFSVNLTSLVVNHFQSFGILGAPRFRLFIIRNLS